IQQKISSSSRLLRHCFIAAYSNTCNHLTTNPCNNLTPIFGSSSCNADTPVASITDINDYEYSLAFTTSTSTNDNLSVTSTKNTDDWNEEIKKSN
ncbi:hypothetical protein F4703DRAFT_1741029, partial [Phycomyces blakesleeanus]